MPLVVPWPVQVAALRVAEDAEAAAFEVEVKELAACSAADEKLLQVGAVTPGLGSWGSWGSAPCSRRVGARNGCTVRKCYGTCRGEPQRPALHLLNNGGTCRPGHAMPASEGGQAPGASVHVVALPWKRLAQCGFQQTVCTGKPGRDGGVTFSRPSLMCDLLPVSPCQHVVLQAQATRLTRVVEAAEAVETGAGGGGGEEAMTAGASRAAGGEPLDLDSLEQGVGVEAAITQLIRAAGGQLGLRSPRGVAGMDT